ncbi:MAG: C39 family peptidase [Anaerolineae bacterium]|nr:C39 family peptidase [Anaerolineae bacterium]
MTRRTVRQVVPLLFLLAALFLSTQVVGGSEHKLRDRSLRSIPAVSKLLGRVDESTCSERRGLSRSENVVAGFGAAYLNQLALSADGERQCGVASAAMVLAMRGSLPVTQDAMATKARQLWQDYPNPTYVSRVVQMLDDNGVAVRTSCVPADEAWERLIAAIDCGAPSIMLSTRLTRSGSGHFIVAIGYRQAEEQREIIAYDPYGYWQGPEEGYLANPAVTDAHAGHEVRYNFDAIWGYGSERCPDGYLLTVRP